MRKLRKTLGILWGVLLVLGFAACVVAAFHDEKRPGVGMYLRIPR